MFTIEEYREELSAEWDAFVTGRAINAGFMHTRRFINYHPPERFTDASLLVRDRDGSIAALVPACEVDDEGTRTFYSHPGCTYGGVVVADSRHKASYVVDIVALIDSWIARHGYGRAVLKLLSGLYTMVDSDLLEYALRNRGFTFDLELNTYVDVSRDSGNLLSSYSNGKRGHVRKALRAGLEFRPLRSDDEIKTFHRVLVANLQKHRVWPVHTVDELLDFARSRLTDIVRFFGVFERETMVAGGMVYDYARAGTIHTTYLAADPAVSHVSPATFLYHGILEEARRMGRRRVAFGISTERAGAYLNRGLIHNKESYGSLHSVNRTARKLYQSDGGIDAGR